ncbi:MAG: hypothetical protein Kow0083_01340 [Methylophaga sp.]|jgi:hypothetical protein
MTGKRLTDKRLLKELAVMLVFKLALLFVIWHQFFSQSPELDNSQATAQQILSSSLQGEKP